MRATAPPDRVPVRSVTRAVSGGTATSARGEREAEQQDQPCPEADDARTAPSRILGCGRRRRLAAGGAAPAAARNPPKAAWKSPPRSPRQSWLWSCSRTSSPSRLTGKERIAEIVGLHRLDVAIARHGDAILRAFELRLQIAEILIGLQLRIVFGHHQEARQGARSVAPWAAWNFANAAGSLTNSGVA